MFGDKPEGKFGQKGAHERQAEKLATGYRLYHPQKLPESQPINESLSMKAKIMAVTNTTAL